MTENQVLATTKYVIENSQFVSINKNKISEYAKNFVQNEEHYWLLDSPYDINTLSEKEKIMLMIVFNAISFSYWGEPYWNVEYKGKLEARGSWSLIAAIFRSKEEGFSILEPGNLAKIDDEKLRVLLRGNCEIPLLENRATILNEIGTVLLTKYDGDATKFVEEANGDAIELLNLVVQQFSSFNDSCKYKGKTVYFNKRAQAMVEGIYSIFDGKGIGKLDGISNLTACADYIIPNLLRNLGILEYTESLATKIDNKEMIEKCSSEEVEIRASTIWAVELIRQALEEKGIKVNALNINDYLWTVGGDVKTPFHRTRTTSY